MLTDCVLFSLEDIEWKLIYVGSAEDTNYDQELDACMVGPVPAGVNSFEFEVSVNPLCTNVESESLTRLARPAPLRPPAYRLQTSSVSR